MVKGLQGIWIIEPGGMCLLSRMFSAEKSMDDAMFSGFITAILAFTQDLVEDTIENIAMGGREIHYQSFGSFSVVVSVGKKSKVKNLPGFRH